MMEKREKRKEKVNEKKDAKGKGRGLLWKLVFWFSFPAPETHLGNREPTWMCQENEIV